LAETLTNEKTLREAAVKQVDAEVAEIFSHVLQAKDRIQQAKDVVGLKTDEFNMKFGEASRLKEDLAAAERSLTLQLEHQGRLAQDHEMDKAKKVELDKIFQECWQPVKNRSEKWGKDWRTRDESIGTLMNVFDEPEAKAEKMLTLALPKILKKLVVERGSFEQKVIDQAETVLMEYVKIIEDRIVRVGDEEARRNALVDDAREKLNLAKTQCAVGAERAKDAETDLQQANAARNSVETGTDQLKQKLADHQKSLELARARLAHFSEGCDEFEKLRNFSCPTTAENSAECLPEPLTPEKEPKPSHMRRPIGADASDDLAEGSLKAS